MNLDWQSSGTNNIDGNVSTVNFTVITIQPQHFPNISVLFVYADLVTYVICWILYP